MYDFDVNIRILASYFVVVNVEYYGALAPINHFVCYVSVLWIYLEGKLAFKYVPCILATAISLPSLALMTRVMSVDSREVVGGEKLSSLLTYHL